jgi:hypothetical protein
MIPGLALREGLKGGGYQKTVKQGSDPGDAKCREAN